MRHRHKKTKKTKKEKNHISINIAPIFNLSPLKMIPRTKATLSTHCHPATATPSPGKLPQTTHQSPRTAPCEPGIKTKKTKKEKKSYLGQYCSNTQLITTQNDPQTKSSPLHPLPPSHCHSITG
jgi:hypothetical protein